MRRLAMLLLALAAAAALAAVSGCGGGAGEAVSEPGAGADLVPASADLYVVVDGDFEGEQWERAEALAERFPALRGLLRDAAGEGGARWEEWQAALGAEIGLVIVNLEYEEAVLLTEPRDAERFGELVADAGGVARELEAGRWAAAADARAIDRLRAAREADGPIGERDDFERLTGELPDEALATAFVRGGPPEDALRDLPGVPGLPRELGALAACLAGTGDASSTALALTAEEEGLGLRSVSERPEGLPPFASGSFGLAERLPAGALAAASGRELGEQAGAVLDCLVERSDRAERRLDRLMRTLGVSLEGELLPLLGDEAALALYGRDALGGGLPALPVAATEVDDEGEALALVDRLARGAASFAGVRSEPLGLDGAEGRRILLGGEELAAIAVADGVLLATSSEAALRAALADGPRLADDPAYAEARERSGAPDEAAGVVYVDGPALLDALPGLTGLDPADLEAVRPLRSLLLWAEERDGMVAVSGLVAID